ncbi:hypothetical protein [Allorhodopirellula heiligendammensis]|uniref:Uncharacterized protein n=1 Tax=Allorhodopirellula heiligendammensis TaxID=2714739 RepID=A0A5C6BZF5_9BACT|nr:hypothetical protein [Allorhodopirellula heiligendammensis]TWU15999.1 hypothetical protein Poly21_32030 [Allorhodopirellula heiligendammensis]
MPLSFRRARPSRDREVLKNELILKEAHVIETIARLQVRISERFPDSGLCGLCGDLLNVARRASERSTKIGRPIIWIRVSGYTLAVSSIILLIWFAAYWASGHRIEIRETSELVATVEAGANVLLLFGATLYFLISLEKRIKRRRALSAIHELRSICHIIDMHQLTKDPERVLQKFQGTTNSPQQQMTPLELNRYLDYCSEMLSLTGKIAALYVRDFDDTDSVASVSDVEQLSTGLSRKIWQKIMILEQSIHRLPATGDAAIRGESDANHEEPESESTEDNRTSAQDCQ